MRHKGFILPLILLVIASSIIVGSIAYFQLKLKPSQSQKPKNFIELSQAKPPSGYEDFFLTSVSKPIEKLTLEILPNYEHIYGAALYKGYLWLSGDGSIIEFDPNTQKIIRYSDPRKADCIGNIVVVEDFLFAACRQGAVNDTYDVKSGDPLPYAVYKINLLNNSLDRIFNKDDGLLNGDNYFLIKDGDTVWVNTFEGIGRINTKTNTVKFYANELGLKDNYAKIIDIDSNYVWLVGIEGLSFFNKKIENWISFTPEIVSGNQTNGSNTIYGFKTTQEGAQVGLFAYSDRKCLVRKYEHGSKQWTTDVDIKLGIPCEENLKTYFPKPFPITPPSFATVDQYALTQVIVPNKSGESTKYEINGRANLYLSPILNGQRYILTSSTIDIIDDTLNLPEVYIRLGSNMGWSSPRFGTGSTIALFLDPESLLGIVVNTRCSPEPRCYDPEIFLVDLKTKKLLKKYDAQQIPHPLDQLTLKKQGGKLAVKDASQKEIFNIDITNYNLSIIQ